MIDSQRVCLIQLGHFFKSFLPDQSAMGVVLAEATKRDCKVRLLNSISELSGN